MLILISRKGISCARDTVPLEKGEFVMSRFAKRVTVSQAPLTPFVLMLLGLASMSMGALLGLSF